jgi:hypothetical protein
MVSAAHPDRNQDPGSSNRSEPQRGRSASIRHCSRRTYRAQGWSRAVRLRHTPTEVGAAARLSSLSSPTRNTVHGRLLPFIPMTSRFDSCRARPGDPEPRNGDGSISVFRFRLCGEGGSSIWSSVLTGRFLTRVSSSETRVSGVHAPFADAITAVDPGVVQPGHAVTYISVDVPAVVRFRLLRDIRRVRFAPGARSHGGVTDDGLGAQGFGRWKGRL